MISPSDILRGKILIVDDQVANVALLEQMLRGAGYSSIESTRDASFTSSTATTSSCSTSRCPGWTDSR
jgi:adenylate cyclase